MTSKIGDVLRSPDDASNLPFFGTFSRIPGKGMKRVCSLSVFVGEWCWNKQGLMWTNLEKNKTTVKLYKKLLAYRFELWLNALKHVVHLYGLKENCSLTKTSFLLICILFYFFACMSVSMLLHITFLVESLPTWMERTKKWPVSTANENEIFEL